MDSLAELLASRIRASVLGFMVPRLGEKYSLTEFSRALEIPVSSLQHECYKLERLGVLVGRREGNSRRYRWNEGPPVNRALFELVVGHLGLDRCLRNAVIEFQHLDAAELVGDLATAESFDLVLIGNLELEHLEIIQRRIATLLDRSPEDVDVAFFGPGEWHVYRTRGGNLVRRMRDDAVMSLVES